MLYTASEYVDLVARVNAYAREQRRLAERTIGDLERDVRYYRRRCAKLEAQQ